MTAFYFQDTDGGQINLTPGKAVCVGRNYIKHIEELNNEVPEDCVLFIKPQSSFQSFQNGIVIPHDKGTVHHEVELAILINTPLKDATETQAIAAIEGVAIALDLTLRELQKQLKTKGLPWEKAKAFDGSCVVTPFVKSSGWNSHTVELKLNGNTQQQASTTEMILSVPKLISEISRWFSLSPGDIILTGTPAGVGPIKKGDQLEVILDQQHHWVSQING